jgi:hypothetical protein
VDPFARGKSEAYAAEQSAIKNERGKENFPVAFYFSFLKSGPVVTE